jgi:glycosyltransferase involved in cell wall biosynthesis
MNLMMFDLSVRGHHPSYIQYLIQYWDENTLPGRLDIVVSRRFVVEHADVLEYADRCSSKNIAFVTISAAEEALLSSRKSRLKRAFRFFQEWQILCRYAKALKATHCLVLYFDTYQIPLLFGLTAPCSFSGIYFRPTFHYDRLTQARSSEDNKFQKWREIFSISRVLKHPQLKMLFCLDPFAVDFVKERYNTDRICHLPDPILPILTERERSQSLKKALNIEEKRTVFLMFGSLTERKGIYQLLDAIASLSDEWCDRLCLLLVGESRISKQIDEQIAKISQIKPIQAIARYQFISDSEIPDYFQISDVILAPYQRHVGMSGILLWAATANKPILSSDYGLMGEMVTRYGLGLTVDSSSPEEIAQGLMECLSQPRSSLGDRAKMKQFVEHNSVNRFTQTIFNSLKDL